MGKQPATLLHGDRELDRSFRCGGICSSLFFSRCLRAGHSHGVCARLRVIRSCTGFTCCGVHRSLGDTNLLCTGSAPLCLAPPSRHGRIADVRPIPQTGQESRELDRLHSGKPYCDLYARHRGVLCGCVRSRYHIRPHDDEVQSATSGSARLDRRQCRRVCAGFTGDDRHAGTCGSESTCLDCPTDPQRYRQVASGQYSRSSLHQRIW